MEIYRHYFRPYKKDEKFSYKKFQKIRNWQYPWVKPHGGLWASRLSSTKGWKDWCESEDMDWCGEYFDFYIKDDANVLFLKELSDISLIFTKYQNYLIQCTENLKFKRYLERHLDDNVNLYNALIPSVVFNFENMLMDGVDAIEVEIENLYYPLYGWDCDSILIMNPDIIVLKEG